MNSIYIATTDLLVVLNKIKNNTVLPKDIEDSLKQLKKELKGQSSTDLDDDEFDIFLSLDNSSM